VRTCLRHGAKFSLVITRNTSIDNAIAAIDEHAWTPVRYPGAGGRSDAGAWISDVEVAEIAYTAFTSTHDRVTARLVVRRVKDAFHPDTLFPLWRYRWVDDAESSPLLMAFLRREHAALKQQHRLPDSAASITRTVLFGT
jgi:hypothetical protein